LLKRGQNILANLFPGIESGLLAGGAVPVDASEMAWFQFGGWKARTTEKLAALFLSRPFLESEIRRRVRALPNVEVVENAEALGLVPSADRQKVQGVTFRRNGSGDETLTADLVIEARGRGARTPVWLEEMGRSKVKETVVKIDIGYGTRTFKMPSQPSYPWKVMVVIGQSPESKRIGMIAPIEGDRWIATLVGILGDHAPTEEAAWLQYAKDLPMPDVYDAIRTAEPLSDIVPHRFPAHQRRHYDQMADFPEGLVVLGDAHCSFSPVYGQGMTTSALGADLLRQHLAGSRSSAIGLSRQFSHQYQRALARISDEPWSMATGEDFRYPEVEGARPFGTSALLWYTKRLHHVTNVDPELCLKFYQTMHLLSPVSALMKPSVVWRVLKGANPLAQVQGAGRPPIQAGARSQAGA
jgi:hypothetical protein